MRIILFLFFVLLISCQLLSAQEYRYTRYDVNNGLAGSNVYCMLQDQQGFMWFGTETGISRFDGTHFKNFGTADGLPDNEILEMFQDSKGRIWMAPFKKTVCYYYKGKIFNRDNDSVLRQVKLNSHILRFAEDNNGDILMMESDQLYLISGQTVRCINSINNKRINACLAISKNAQGGFLVVDATHLYEFRDNVFHVSYRTNLPYANYKYIVLNEHFIALRPNIFRWIIKSLKTGSERTYPDFSNLLSMQLMGDSLIFWNGQMGSVIRSWKKVEALKIFLEDKSVTKTLIDNEGNYWFTTLGEGVFRLASENMASIRLQDDHGRKLSAYSMKIMPHKWFIGADMMHVFEIRHDSAFAIQKKKIWDEWGENISSRVTAIEWLNEKENILGSDMMLQVIPAKKDFTKKSSNTIKSIFRSSEDELVVATRNSVLSFSLPDLFIKDTLWKERATAVYSRNDTVYVGTLDGLYLVMKDKSGLFAGKDEPLLRNRVNVITGSPDGMLWIATSGAGVLGYRNGRIEKKISTREGLVSDNCRTIFINGKEMWVGTDKGLNRVIIHPGGYHIIKFTEGDGLSSNVINAVGVDSNIVVVATPEGVNFFDADRISFASRCSLVMDDILVSDRHLDHSSKFFSLKHRDNNIRFEFAGISFRSGGEMTYRHRLLGLDTSWLTTKENFVSYPILPSGDYQLELQAINKFGIRSQLITVPFNVEKLLIEKTWFRVLILLASMVAIALFVIWLLRRVRRKEKEKSDILRRIAELEQLALKSQMNPHFIFNCLNSIQQFVLDKDVAGSNKFITGFSRLIRQTLEISAKKEISLSEEVLYLSTYLELEKTRFENKFNFEIRTEDGLDPDQFYLPPMMLQPFVENSIRHGIRYRPDHLGKILISFRKMHQELICIVEDNGIGRTEALRHKSRNPIEYQSKGMSLIASRVEFLNRHSNRPITISIEDLEDNNKIAIGTRVVMKFPLENELNNTNHD